MTTENDRTDSARPVNGGKGKQQIIHEDKVKPGEAEADPSDGKKKRKRKRKRERILPGLPPGLTINLSQVGPRIDYPHEVIKTWVEAGMKVHHMNGRSPLVFTDDVNEFIRNHPPLPKTYRAKYHEKRQARKKE